MFASVPIACDLRFFGNSQPYLDELQHVVLKLCVVQRPKLGDCVLSDLGVGKLRVQKLQAGKRGSADLFGEIRLRPQV